MENCDRYSFADSPAGWRLAIKTSLSCRRMGFKTRLEVIDIKGFSVLQVLSIPPKRKTRKELGL